MMKNRATLKFENFTARPHSFCICLRLARAGAALCCARPAEAICLEISSADAKPMSKNLKSLNFKNGNATSTNCEADHDILLGAGRDINSRPDRAANFKISNANLKADLARPKADFR